MSMSHGLVCGRFGCLSWRSCGYYSLELRDNSYSGFDYHFVWCANA